MADTDCTQIDVTLAHRLITTQLHHGPATQQTPLMLPLHFLSWQ